MYNHNQAQQSKNHVHISWDILYERPTTDIITKTKQCKLKLYAYFMGCINAYKGKPISLCYLIYSLYHIPMELPLTQMIILIAMECWKTENRELGALWTGPWFLFPATYVSCGHTMNIRWTSNAATYYMNIGQSIYEIHCINNHVCTISAKPLV